LPKRANAGLNEGTTTRTAGQPTPDTGLAPFPRDAPAQTLKRRTAADGTLLCACCDTTLTPPQGRGRPSPTCGTCRRTRREHLIKQYARNRSQARADERARATRATRAKDVRPPEPAATTTASAKLKPTTARKPPNGDNGDDSVTPQPAQPRDDARQMTQADIQRALRRRFFKDDPAMLLLYSEINMLNEITRRSAKPPAHYKHQPGYQLYEVAEKLIRWREQVRPISQ
jgi:hypothetical protein